MEIQIDEATSINRWCCLLNLKQNSLKKTFLTHVFKKKISATFPSSFDSLKQTNLSLLTNTHTQRSNMVTPGFRRSQLVTEV